MAIKDYTVAQIKKNGAVRGLERHIELLIKLLETENWDGIRSAGKFVGLGNAITNAQLIITKMQDSFTALKELDPSQE